MKSTLAVAALLVLCAQNVSAFTPMPFTRSASSVRSIATKHAAIVDPSVFADVHQHVDTVQSFFTSLTLSDATDALVDSVTSAAPAASVNAVVDAVASTPEAADAVAQSSGNGWFGFLEAPIEFLLTLIHGGLEGAGLGANAWGFSILGMTAIIKVLTYPLTFAQLKSTESMKVLQPIIKDIQAKYQSNPEVMNQKIAEVYQVNDVNPLSGCIPSLVQIPVFIGLYRAVLTLAKNNELNERFFFLPNLEGPTYGADPAHGLDWLFQNWVDGTPSLGWEDTIAFLILPVFLVISQYVSLSLTTPKDQEQPGFLKFIPLLLGYFTLGLPSALGIYWVANNVITTATTLQVRNSMKSSSDPVIPSAGGGASVVDVPASSFNPAPMREKPSGFGSTDWSEDGEVKPITPVDAEVISKDVTEEMPVSGSSNQPPKKRGGKKKRKKNKKN